MSVVIRRHLKLKLPGTKRSPRGKYQFAVMNQLQIGWSRHDSMHLLAHSLEHKGKEYSTKISLNNEPSVFKPWISCTQLVRDGKCFKNANLFLSRVLTSVENNRFVPDRADRDVLATLDIFTTNLRETVYRGIHALLVSSPCCECLLLKFTCRLFFTGYYKQPTNHRSRISNLLYITWRALWTHYYKA